MEYQNEELLRLQKFEERFFATISHEMRTLLNSIINDILDLSKIEENKLLLEDVSFDLKQLVNTVAKGFLFIVKEKRIDLNVSLSEDLPTFIKADPTGM